jgi:hypothetical protein
MQGRRQAVGVCERPTPLGKIFEIDRENPLRRKKIVKIRDLGKNDPLSKSWRRPCDVPCILWWISASMEKNQQVCFSSFPGGIPNVRKLSSLAFYAPPEDVQFAMREIGSLPRFNIQLLESFRNGTWTQTLMDMLLFMGTCAVDRWHKIPGKLCSWITKSLPTR